MMFVAHTWGFLKGLWDIHQSIYELAPGTAALHRELLARFTPLLIMALGMLIKVE